MDISKIDKNFEIQKTTEINGNVFALPCEPFTLKGCVYSEKDGFVRMPLDIAEKISDTVHVLSRATAGVRVLFSTDSTVMKINSKMINKCVMHHMASVGSVGFTLNEVINGKEYFVCNLLPPPGDEDLVGQCKLCGGKMRDYVLYFPLYSGVLTLNLEFDANSTVKEYKKYRDIKPILYYGSSITQGGCATKANNCYQAYISEWLNVDFLNISFSGGAKAEPLMNEYLSNVDCSVFVCDYDHNAPNVEHLENTHYKLYETFRSKGKNKNTPIVFLSMPGVYFRLDGFERAKVIKNTYQKAIENGDKNVYLIEGANLYPDKIREHCAVDGIHPTDLGFYFMAEKIYEVLKEIL